MILLRETVLLRGITCYSKFNCSYLSPNTSAIALYTTFPSTTFNPKASAGSSLHACFHPFPASAVT